MTFSYHAYWTSWGPSTHVQLGLELPTPPRNKDAVSLQVLQVEFSTSSSMSDVTKSSQGRTCVHAFSKVQVNGIPPLIRRSRLISNSSD